MPRLSSTRQPARPRAPFGSLTLARFTELKYRTFALAADLAKEGQDYAKKNAPWTDRTGRARERLHFFAFQRRRGTTTDYVIQGDHGIWYGFYLERKPQSNGGRPILRPTMDAIMPDGHRQFRELWRNTGVRTRRGAIRESRRRRGLTRSQVRRRFAPEDQ